MSLHERFDFLLAQRQVIMSSFECAPKNLIDNTQALFISYKALNEGAALSQSVSQSDSQNACQNDSQSLLLKAKNVTELVSALESEVDYDVQNQLVIIQLFLKLHCQQNSQQQCLLFQRLFDSSVINSAQSFPNLALLASQYLIHPLVLSSDGKTAAQIHQYLLLCIFQGQRLNRKQASERLNTLMTPVTPVTTLYVELLMEVKKAPLKIYENVIELEMVDSILFDFYIASLDEEQLTLILNVMSQDDTLRAKVIEVMGYSGFIKFVPFLAKAMQQPSQTMAAFNALKIILGPLLEQAISLQWQSESDLDKRCEYLQFYSAKLLDRWPAIALNYNQNNTINRMLNGVEVNESSIEFLLTQTSPVHQKIAQLHQYRLHGTISKAIASTADSKLAS